MMCSSAECGGADHGQKSHSGARWSRIFLHTVRERPYQMHFAAEFEIVSSLLVPREVEQSLGSYIIEIFTSPTQNSNMQVKFSEPRSELF
jgi:hypothetical protein